jgi:predicted nucleotidyltransferase
LAVLYGSLARGDEDEGSDLDLLVSLCGEGFAGRLNPSTRLRGVAGRRVDMADLNRIEADAPLLLDRILDEGRVLVDRDRQWPQLRERRRAIRARARRDQRHRMAAASQTIAELAHE